MARQQPPKQWVKKTLVGVLLGFVLGVLCSGLLIHLTPGGMTGPTMKQAISTYVLLLVWISVAGLVYLFHSARSAWIVLGGTALVAASLLALVLFFGK